MSIPKIMRNLYSNTIRKTSPHFIAINKEKGNHFYREEIIHERFTLLIDEIMIFLFFLILLLSLALWLKRQFDCFVNRRREVQESSTQNRMVFVYGETNGS